MRVLLDTNVVLDVLAARQPWVADSSAVLSLAEAGKAEGYVAVHTVTTLHYLLCKHLDRSRAAAAILDLLRFVKVATASHASVLEALSLGWSDFEDALQGVSALAVGAAYIVTRDPEDFGDIGIPPVAPGEFLALVGAAG